MKIQSAGWPGDPQALTRYIVEFSAAWERRDGSKHEDNDIEVIVPAHGSQDVCGRALATWYHHATEPVAMTAISVGLSVRPASDDLLNRPNEYFVHSKFAFQQAREYGLEEVRVPEEGWAVAKELGLPPGSR